MTCGCCLPLLSSFLLSSWFSWGADKVLHVQKLDLLHCSSCPIAQSCSSPFASLDRGTEQQLDYQHCLNEKSDWPQSVVSSPQIWLLRPLTKAMNISLLCEILGIWPVLEWVLSFASFVRVLLCNQQVLTSNEREESRTPSAFHFSTAHASKHFLISSLYQTK